MGRWRLLGSAVQQRLNIPLQLLNLNLQDLQIVTNLHSLPAKLPVVDG